MEAAIVFIALFAAVFGIVFLFLITRNKERMALIEKGADASLFATGKQNSWSFSWSKFTLKIGMLAMGIAIGVLTGALLTQGNILNEDANYATTIFFFGGLSLVLFYVFDKRSK